MWKRTFKGAALNLGISVGSEGNEDEDENENKDERPIFWGSNHPTAPR